MPFAVSPALCCPSRVLLLAERAVVSLKSAYLLLSLGDDPFSVVGCLCDRDASRTKESGGDDCLLKVGGGGQMEEDESLGHPTWQADLVLWADSCLCREAGTG